MIYQNLHVRPDTHQRLWRLLSAHNACSQKRLSLVEYVDLLVANAEREELTTINRLKEESHG